MESFPDNFRYDPDMKNYRDPEKLKVETLNAQRALLYAEIKHNECRGSYTFNYRFVIYDMDGIFLLLEELYSRYPERFTLSFRYDKTDHKKVSYKDFVKDYGDRLLKYKPLPLGFTINMQLKDYPTRDSFCEYHSKVHQKEEFEMSHSPCKRHGHCLYPIGCPLIGKCVKECVKE